MLQIIGLLVAVHVCARAVDMLFAASERYHSSTAWIARLVGAIALAGGILLGAALLLTNTPNLPGGLP